MEAQPPALNRGGEVGIVQPIGYSQITGLWIWGWKAESSDWKGGKYACSLVLPTVNSHLTACLRTDARLKGGWRRCHLFNLTDTLHRDRVPRPVSDVRSSQSILK